MNDISSTLIQRLSTQKIELRDENGNLWCPPADGSLGLLALGYEGVEAWRRARAGQSGEAAHG